LVLIAVLATAVVLEILFHLVIAPRFAISRVIVESELDLPNERILEIARIDGTEDFFSIEPGVVARNLERFHLVKSASVEKVFPDMVKIVITGRKPVVVSFAEEKGRSVPLLIDEEGVVFRKGAAGISDWSLPVLSGIQFERVSVGTRLPAFLKPFLQDLRELQLSAPTYFNLVSEFRIVKNSEFDFEVILYPVSHRVPVRIGNEIDAELCSFLLVALDVLQGQEKLQNVQEIDFRTGEIVYKLREG
jgi:cell division protein FtsQ